MAGLFHPVVFRGQGGGADKHISHPHLAAPVGLAVVAGEPFHHHSGEVIFPVQEDVFIGDEHMVQHHQGFLAAKFGIPQVDTGSRFHFPGVAGLAAVDHVQPVRIGGAGKADGPVPVRFLHGDGGHENVPVGVDGPGLVDLGPADHDPIRPPFHHVDEHVRIRLFMRGFGPVPLGVGHGSVHSQVMVLDVNQELFEILMVVGAVFLVHFVGGGIHRVEGIHAHTALEAAGGLLAQEPLHLHLFHQVLCRLMEMGEPVDGMAGEAGGGGHQVFVPGILGQGVGHGHTVDGRTDDGVVHPVVHLFSEQVHPGMELPQAFNVLGGGHESHSKTSFGCTRVVFGLFGGGGAARAASPYQGHFIPASRS